MMIVIIFLGFINLVAHMLAATLLIIVDHLDNFDNFDFDHFGHFDHSKCPNILSLKQICHRHHHCCHHHGYEASRPV